MGWFNDQINYRIEHEQEMLQGSYQNIMKSVLGYRLGQIGPDTSGNDAVSRLLKYFSIKEISVPEKIKTMEDRLDYLLSSSGVQYRTVDLEKGWYKDAIGPMIAVYGEKMQYITVLPGQAGGYVFIDPDTGKQKRVNAEEEKKIGKKAICFYRPFPMRALKLRDLIRYMRECLTARDLAGYLMAAGVVTLIGMLIPKLNYILIGDVVTYGSNQLLIAVMSFLFLASCSSILMTAVRQLLLKRISTKVSSQVNAACMMRVLTLPATFFRQYTAGELNQYLAYMNGLCDSVINIVLSSGLMGVFSLVYFFQLAKYAASLVIPSLIVTILTLAIAMAAAMLQTVISREQMKLDAKEKGLVYALISGVEKVRLAGAENRAFAKWANLYAEKSELIYNPPMLIKLSSVITLAITMLGTIVIYYIAVKNHVSPAQYTGFNAAYAYVSGAFSSLAGIALTMANIRPGMELSRPLMEAVPETEAGMENVTDLKGEIELSHVSFRYDENSPWILQDLNLTIKRGQYTAIVGKTGCGKSTIMRLLLGFEKPVTGSIFYDHKDIRRLNMHSVRQKIGSVMQDGKIFLGSMYENIVISEPTLGINEAWEAAEIAGLAEDIRRMPMGMHTMLRDGAGGISGGQKQRLMIARAVAPKPKILFLDEATSALDNITQKKVSDSLDRMRCTRVVIAHRLSTIKNCDRILVLNEGKIIEDGTYEELIAANGFFAELVEKQRL